ncbi:pre-mRNA-splicing factor SYF2 [Cryptococcus bacillisporus CA1873]|uniref:Pre-mRNA-splicing factor SYF2 n=1 Tax=Cryptococcus bacillisporus CA1873 TaxID=1296111 RepID=A0ABR5B759_CRYGA|nr:pre-mRNA-splicing factor SYF2 [Cryptococcus bacillisporus CA1873]|eukprot:KIR59408.1 pre-mRNA-splicing factor SYF2 [Cryptococcus gattii CA1873]
MPPRKPKSRDVKSTAPSPSPSIVQRRSSRASRKEPASAVEVVEERDEVTSESEETESEAKRLETVEGDTGETEQEEHVEEVAEKEQVKGKDRGKEKMSMAERMAKMKELRMKMDQSAAQNRRELVEDHQKAQVTAKELARLEKQRKLAQTLRLKAEAEENGEDIERKKNWEWTIEDNERWQAKLEEQKVKQDTHFHNAEDDAYKKYNRNLRATKADLVAYERQKEAALGLTPGTLVPAGATSSSLTASSSKTGLSGAEDLYRGADTLAYGDNKPSEDAVDRVISKINKDIGKKKRAKKDDEDGEVNYINERNKVFNKKISRYFDKYTKEIRANFERGTAL